MSNEVMQVLLAVISLMGIIATGIFSAMARNAAQKATTRVNEVSVKVDEYHKEVNGMKAQLVEEVRGRAQAEGEKKGAEDNQAKTDAGQVLQPSLPVQEVKIVEQAKPLEVKIQKDKT